MQSTKIHCIGDSHVSFFSGQDKMQPPWPHTPGDQLRFFKTYRLGAVLAESLSRYGSSMKGRELLFVLLDRKMPMTEFWTIPPGSKLLFCFGEIDCRFHVIKQAEKRNVSIETVARETASKYMDVLKEIQDLGYEIMVWNVVPPTNPSRSNPEYPHYGEYAQRIKATTIFNEVLEQKCREYHFDFISIYDQVITEKKEANLDYYMDEVHLSQRAMPFAMQILTARYPAIFNSPEVPEKGSFLKKIFGR